MISGEANTPASAGRALYRYRFGAAEFDEARFELRVSGLALELERKPLEVLLELLRHAGEVLTKEELFDSVWAGRITVENVLANAVAKLRKALGEAQGSNIVTVPRLGYRLDGGVERIAVGRAVRSTLALSAGQPVPERAHFVLEQQLAHTLGAEVWRARHSKTGELRVYKFSLDGERLSALKREATLARVLRQSLGERRDFVRVIDWNFESAPFFLECEYGGDSLAEWAVDHLAAVSQAERLSLFLDIADAVAAAHSVGVLHKDLKPANVLVAAEDGEGWRVRLTDFGSGRLLEPGRLQELGITQLGMTVTQNLGSDSSSGTPLYLAPEVIGGHSPTVQSDVYSLGVMLYQLLIGDLRTPMTSGWEHGIDDALLCSDIAAATDGNPARRLASVAELTERLRTREARAAEREHQRNAEQRATAAERALERARTRRPWIAAAAAVLVAGLGASLWLYHEGDRARRLAERNAARADAINRFLNWEVLANTGTLLSDSDRDPTMRAVLKRASQSVGESFADDPQSEGWIRLAIGEGLGGLNDIASAISEQRRAIELLERGLGPNDAKTLDAMYTLASNLLDQGQLRESGALMDQADARMGTRLQESNLLSSRSWLFRAFLQISYRHCDNALSSFERALSIQQSLKGALPFDRFNIRSWIGQSLLCLGRQAEARTLYEEMLAEPAADDEIGPILTALARMGYGQALADEGRNDEARQLFTSAVASLKEAAGADNLYAMVAERQFGDFLAEVGELAEARKLIDHAHESLLRQYGAKHMETLRSLRSLGVVDYRSGRIDQALARLSQARTDLTEVFGDGAADVQAASYYLALAQLQSGHLDVARQAATNLDWHEIRAAFGGSGWELQLDSLRKRLAP